MSLTGANRPQRVLFVDDEPRVLRGLLRLLRDDRWTPESAERGAEALEKLASALCDVIVSDYRMPGMDGVTLLEHVRVTRIPRRCATPATRRGGVARRFAMTSCASGR